MNATIQRLETRREDVALLVAEGEATDADLREAEDALAEAHRDAERTVAVETARARRSERERHEAAEARRQARQQAERAAAQARYQAAELVVAVFEDLEAAIVDWAEASRGLPGTLSRPIPLVNWLNWKLSDLLPTGFHRPSGSQRVELLEAERDWLARYLEHEENTGEEE